MERIRSGRRGICSYASKYAAKMEQKDVPPEFSNVGRFWGISGCRARVAASTAVMAGDFGSELAKRKLEEIHSLVGLALSEGEATIVHSDPTIRVTRLHTSYLKERILALFAKISIAEHQFCSKRKLHYGIFWDAEMTIDF